MISWFLRTGSSRVSVIGPLASTILDTIRDSLRLHVGFCRWRSDQGDLLWVVSARANDGQRWVAKRGAYHIQAL